MYGLLGPGDTGDCGCGLHAGLYPPGLNPLASEAAGENPAAPGVIPLPIPGLQASAYAGVAPMFHGVICGDFAVGEPAAPKNIPVPRKKFRCEWNKYHSHNHQ